MERVLGNKVKFSDLVIYSLSILMSCQFTNEPNREISRGVFQNCGVCGQVFPLLPSPSPFHFFCSRSNFRAITRLEMLATQARKNFFMSIGYLNFSVIWIPPKNFICPSGKLRIGITSPVAKSTSPRLSDTTFFACWSLIWNGNFLCLSFPNASLALHYGGFAPGELQAAKGLFIQFMKCIQSCNPRFLLFLDFSVKYRIIIKKMIWAEDLLDCNISTEFSCSPINALKYML